MLEEHVIKFMEDCLREHAESGDTRFPLAAADAILADEARKGRVQSRGICATGTTRTFGSG